VHKPRYLYFTFWWESRQDDVQLGRTGWISGNWAKTVVREPLWTCFLREHLETLREGAVMMHATVIARRAAMAEANCMIFLGFWMEWLKSFKKSNLQRRVVIKCLILRRVKNAGPRVRRRRDKRKWRSWRPTICYGLRKTIWEPAISEELKASQRHCKHGGEGPASKCAARLFVPLITYTH